MAELLRRLNYAIADDAAILPSGDKAHASANIDAIRPLKQIEDLGTPETADGLRKKETWLAAFASSR